MEELAFPLGSFDIVTSSLAFHYVADYSDLIRRVSQWLVPAGLLVFSTEHPIYTARASDEGWLLTNAGRSVWTIDDYGVEGPRDHDWSIADVRRYHRTVATLLNELVMNGFAVEKVAEPLPSGA